MSNKLIKDLVLEVLEDEKEKEKNKDFLSERQTRKLTHQLNRKLEGNYYACILSGVQVMVKPTFGLFKYGSRPAALTYAERMMNLINNNFTVVGGIELIENVDKNFELSYNNYIFVIHAEHPFITKFKSSFRPEREKSEFVKALNNSEEINLYSKVKSISNINTQNLMPGEYHKYALINNADDNYYLSTSDTKFKINEEVINTNIQYKTSAIVCNKNLTIVEAWD